MKIDNFNFTSSNFNLETKDMCVGQGAYNGFNPEREAKIAQNTNFSLTPLNI